MYVFDFNDCVFILKINKFEYYNIYVIIKEIDLIEFGNMLCCFVMKIWFR